MEDAAEGTVETCGLKAPVECVKRIIIRRKPVHRALELYEHIAKGDDTYEYRHFVLVLQLSPHQKASTKNHYHKISIKISHGP